MAACSKKRAEYLEVNLKRVQHLQLEMQLYNDGVCDPRYLVQPEWFRGALMRVKQGSVEKYWLKSLDIQVCEPQGWSGLIDHELGQFDDERDSTV